MIITFIGHSFVADQAKVKEAVKKLNLFTHQILMIMKIITITEIALNPIQIQVIIGLFKNAKSCAVKTEPSNRFKTFPSAVATKSAKMGNTQIEQIPTSVAATQKNNKWLFAKMDFSTVKR